MSNPGPASLSVRSAPREGGVWVIEADGPVDAATYRVLASEIETVLGRHPKVLALDFLKVPFINSAGVGVVLAAQKVLKGVGAHLLLVNLQPQIRKVFDIVKAIPSERLFADLREMDAYLAEIQRQVREGGGT